MNLSFPGATYMGPPISDPDVLSLLPFDLRDSLQKMNGFIAWEGGLHLRGICREPAWHSLELFWTGEYSFSRRYPAVRKADIPFGQDCLGDQFLIRDGQVLRLRAESGDVVELKMDFLTFLDEVRWNPSPLLELEPLTRFKNEGKNLSRVGS